MSLPSVLQNLSLPVIGSPLFIASGPQLVIEQCKAGIVGSFPALNARPAEMLDTWLTQIKEALAAHKAAHPDARAAPAIKTAATTRRTWTTQRGSLHCCVSLWRTLSEGVWSLWRGT